MDRTERPLIVILGPTAVGKTEISIRLADTLGGEIVSADSRLFYRGMDIGTAKPTPEQMARVPHHLIDVAEPDQEWNLAIFLPAALRAIRDIQDRGRVPFLVGGTGQYIRAVVQGWDLPASRPDPDLRRVLQNWAEDVGVEGIRSRLQVLDPEAAAGIDGPNLRRMIRALEVILTSGRKFSQQRNKGDSPFKVLQIGLIRPRSELYRRADQRLDQMIEEGLVEEVEGLLEAGFSADLPSLSAIGYKQIVSYLLGEVSLEEALRQIRRITRRFIRQQANWFRETDPDICWFEVKDGQIEPILEQIQHFLS
jgi:tRNA dimethylallyltransferase